MRRVLTANRPCTQNLLGRSGGQFLLFGMLTRSPEGRLCLEDLDEVVPPKTSTPGLSKGAAGFFQSLRHSASSKVSMAREKEAREREREREAHTAAQWGLVHEWARACGMTLVIGIRVTGLR